MRYILIFFFTIFLSIGSLISAERVVSTLGEVDLVEVDKFNDDGLDFATDYYVYNRGRTQVYISVIEVKGVNIKNKLITGKLSVDPNQAGYLGWVEQRNPKQGSNWKLEWQVE